MKASTDIHPIRAQTRMTQRKNLQGILKTTPATVFGRKLRAKKAADPEGLKALKKGNFDGVPSAAALKQMAYEDATAGDLDKSM